MKLYKLSQDENDFYDTYDSVVVAAETEEEAKFIHPEETIIDWGGIDGRLESWCNVDHVKVEYIGEAKGGTEKGVILGSFNAG